MAARSETLVSLVERRDTIWWHKMNGLARRAIVRGALNWQAHPVVLTEYPKSGGSWLSQMLAAALDIPYTRNRLPTTGKQIMHGCFQKVHPKLDTVVVWRDGRDTMVSYYYHTMFDKPITSAMAGTKLRRHLAVTDPYDIEATLPRFIEWSFNGGYPRFSWADFVDKWYEHDGPVFTRYEDCLEEPVKELDRLLKFCGFEAPKDLLDKVVSDHSFEKQSNRKKGEEDVHSFIRKGIAGDWKNAFSLESSEIFAHYAGEQLIRLGYEHDDLWVARQHEMHNLK